MQTCLHRAQPLLGLAIVTPLLTVLSAQAQYADRVTQYTPGTDATAGYTQASSSLGEPSRITPGEYGGPVDPFNPAYLDTQLVSLGAGGSLTVEFLRPVANHAGSSDFLIFGGAGFVITNAYDADFNVIGKPATDGSLFGDQTGTSRVSVSTDGITFFTLNPKKAPSVEGLFPTDGQGDFTRPVPISPISYADFAGLTLEGIRSAYAGSGGGSAYDLAWAQDNQGAAVELDSIRFVRVDILSGHAEIDAFSVIQVPEPTSWMLAITGLTAGWTLWSPRRRS